MQLNKPKWRNWQTCLPAGRPAHTTQNFMHYVYVIKSIVHNYRYVGIAKDPQKRINQHNAGREKTTRSKRPYKVLLIECLETRAEAREREKYLKSGIGKEWIKTHYE